VLHEEIVKARELSGGKKPLGINAMVALSNYESIIRQSVVSGVDFIISGAGLPINLPEYVGAADVALIPVVSSGRALSVVVNAWQRRYNRRPDAVIIEGPNCGGHLGFSPEQLEHPETRSLEILFTEAKSVLDEAAIHVPIIAAGEIACLTDIERMLAIGYNGVQIGTKLLAAEETGMDRRSKQVFIDARPEDVVVIKSPVGLPVRVLKTPLVERHLRGEREKFGCPYRCLRTCNPAKAPFCIAKALLATWRGDVENGLYMTGCNVNAVTGIFSVKDFFDTLKS